MFYFNSNHASGQDRAFQSDQQNNAMATPIATRMETAARVREDCDTFMETVLADPIDLEGAFGQTVTYFFGRHHNWRICLDRPEMHMRFLSVEVFPRYPDQGVAGIVKRQALLNGLRSGYAVHALKKGVDLSGLLTILVKDVCLVEGSLILELPYSIFPACYPGLCQALEDGVYKAFREGLEMLAEIW